MSAATARVLRIATRESALALWQAEYVAARLREADPGRTVELVPMSTLGDRDRVEPLRQFGGQGVFTREVQRAVLDNHADLAVHSLKDLPTESAPGLTLAGVPQRAPRFDALLLPAGRQGTLADLPSAARIGTGSPRRRSQLLRVRDDLVLMEIRGNVETRIRKLDEGEFDAIILAEAGLRRLGLDNRISQLLEPPQMYPAVGQAALGIECRDDDEEVIRLLEAISDPDTQAEVVAERACLRTLRAGCHAPVGVLSSVRQGEIEMTAVVLNPEGTRYFEAQAKNPVDQAESTGEHAASLLIAQGASEVL